MARIFVSHASADRLDVQAQVISLLRRHQLDTWYSTDDIRGAEEWEHSIRQGLQDCDWFLVALSPHAVASRWVRTEVHWAVERRWGRIVPLMLAECDPSDLHLRLGQLQYVDFRRASDKDRRKLVSLWGVPYVPDANLSTPAFDRQRERDRVAALPDFELLKTLGRGGSASVFLARTRTTGQLVAIKALTIEPDVLDHAWVTRRTALDLTRIQHPSIGAVLKVIDEGEAAFVIMEYIDGPTLAERMKERYSREAAMKLVGLIADGLQAAHDHGIVHHDLKPANVLLDRLGRPHLIDFFSYLDSLPKGLILGTPSYVSPERIRGEAVDARTDIWSLGVILYELLTGRRPFLGSIVEQLSQMYNGSPVPPSDLDPAVPDDLSSVCLKALALCPDARYQTAAEFAACLRRTNEDPKRL